MVSEEHSSPKIVFGYVDSWIVDSRIRQLSPRTLEMRQFVLSLFRDFAINEEQLDVNVVRRFMLSLMAREGPKGKVSASTIQTYYKILRTWFNWLIENGVLETSPLKTIKPPLVRDNQIQPFSDAQVSALFVACTASPAPARDTAILALLLDSGMRASELCSLLLGDVDIPNSRITIRIGKGGKSREVFLGKESRRLLHRYLQDGGGREVGDPVFRAVSDRDRGNALTRSGLYQIIRDLGRAANIRGVRCSPHTFRHTFAVNFLRAGGNQFALMVILGHTDLAMTRRYVALAQADIEHQQRTFSPIDRIMGKKKR